VPKQLAFVLSGGGARGALQIGAVRALLEAGYQPDILVGASVGAVNVAFLTLHGLTLKTVDKLQRVWIKTPAANLFPSNYLWISARALINRPVKSYSQRMREFFMSRIGPQCALQGFPSATPRPGGLDLVSSQLVISGLDPEQSVLEGVLASIAFPPWLLPQQNNGRFMIDGGALSCLPIEPAMALGATEVIALDLIDLRGVPLEGGNFRQFAFRLMYTVQQRQAELELALAVNATFQFIAFLFCHPSRSRCGISRTAGDRSRLRHRARRSPAGRTSARAPSGFGFTKDGHSWRC
jgi:NTE family protein